MSQIALDQEQIDNLRKVDTREAARQSIMKYSKKELRHRWQLPDPCFPIQLLEVDLRDGEARAGYEVEIRPEFARAFYKELRDEYTPVSLSDHSEFSARKTSFGVERLYALEDVITAFYKVQLDESINDITGGQPSSMRLS